MAQILMPAEAQLEHRGEYNASNQLIAVGHRYTADGWSEPKDLFRFHIDFDSQESHLEQAQRLAVPGVGGAATRGCEDVKSVRYTR